MSPSPTSLPDEAEVLWRPPADVLATTRIGAYLAWLERERGLRFTDYAQLWEWSVTDLDAFWGSIWDHFGVQAASPAERVLGNADGSGRGMPGARWFPGSRVNYAAQALRPDGVDDTAVAVVAHSQSRGRVELTWGELRTEVARAAAGLRALGVGPGDRVAAYLPNIPETLVAFLATASLGARVVLVRARVRHAQRDRPLRTRSSRRCCSPSTATATASRAIDRRDGGRRHPRRAAVADRHRRACRTSSPRRGSPPGALAWADLLAGAPDLWPSSRSPSTTRSTSCTPRAPPGCPSRSCTATAASSSSTSRRWRCTATSARATASSGSPPRAG